MIRPYKIEIVNDEKIYLLYPKHVENKKVEKVAFGSSCIQAKGEQRNDNQKLITISSGLANKLLFPRVESIHLHIFMIDDTLFLGPLMGVFTAGFTSIPVQPVGSRTKFFTDVCKNGLKEGIFPIVFGLQHVNWNNGTINGYTFLNGKWERIEVPFPNVVYDRLPNRTVENLEQIQKMKKRLEHEYFIPWYNPGFFNKQHIYNKLKIHDRTSIYLPKTTPFESSSHLQKMLDDYTNVYVKANGGSLGKGIFQVIKKSPKEYYCRFRDEDNKNRLLKFSSIHGFVKKMFPKEKYKNFIIQQGIPLMTFDDRKADFRVHTNKGTDGKWYVTAIGGKTVQSHTATTHIASGGSVQTLEEMFPDEHLRKETKKRLVTAALTLSQGIDDQVDGNIAEIGFDLGIDEKGKVWMFEANSKPGRSIFTHPELKKFEQVTLKMAILYSISLTNEAIKNFGESSYEPLLQ